MQVFEYFFHLWLCAGAEPRHDTPGLQAVADELPISHLPSCGASKWGEDDQWGSERPARQHCTLLPHGPHLWPGVFWQLQQAGQCVLACLLCVPRYLAVHIYHTYNSGCPELLCVCYHPYCVFQSVCFSCVHLIIYQRSRLPFMLIHLPGSVQEATIWLVFLPRPDPREEKVWTYRLEHSLRVQWDRPPDLCKAATHVPWTIPGS